MPRHTGAVFVDTNVILECHRVGSWKALTGGYRVETVEECVRETQVGAQRRRQEQRISKDRLLERLGAVHSVADRELAALGASHSRHPSGRRGAQPVGPRDQS